jgi:hypothetical protein
VATANPLRVELGQRLRAFRERAKMLATAIDDDAELGWYAGKMSKVETGTRVPVATEINRLSDLFAISADERVELHALAKAARKRTPMPHVADFARSYVLLEQSAQQIDYFDAELIPALLQSPDYARTLLALSSTEELEERVPDLEDRVAERMSRRELLLGPDAPRLRVVLGEAALHRLTADFAHEQLELLLEMNKRRNVEVRILPFEVGLYRVIGVGFTVVKLSSPSITRVYLEGATAATYLHELDETEFYQRRFEELWNTYAADKARSETILRRHIQQLG